MDKISIRKLEVYAYHGVFEEEQLLGQKFYVTADLYTDTSMAAENDDLTLSVDYGAVSKSIVHFMKSIKYKLIETAVNRLADMILLTYPAVKAIDLTLEKPNAPVPYALETIAVSIHRERHIAYIGIGSNLGEREELLSAAITMLDQMELISVRAISPLYETEPYGYTDQPPFLNGCLEISTLLSPNELLNALHLVENELGRVRTIHWGPRTVDLDILLYDDLVLDQQDLHIPHIDMANRLFVLKPLSDIAGYVRHPYLNKTISQLLADLAK